MMQCFKFIKYNRGLRQTLAQTLALVMLCSMCVLNNTARSASIEQSQTQYGLYPLLSELDMPWAVKSDAQSRLWITLMSGRIVVTAPVNLYHSAKPIVSQKLDIDLPELYVAGQGGLMDLIILSDSTAAQKHILVTYAKGTSRANTLVIQRIDLSWVHTEERWEITANKPIFTVQPSKSTPVHYGARLVQLPDESILVTVGDGFDWREQAQNKDSGLGKILRMSTAGKALADNPFYTTTILGSDPNKLFGSDPNIAKRMTQWVYSIGHRNPQGLLLDDTGEIWAHEHGPAGGDEINLIKPGLNYGWPVITQGVDYSGAKITPFTQYPGMTPPVVNWTPSIAPSGFIRYQGALFPELAGAFLVTSLKFKAVIAVNLKNGIFASQVMLDTRKLTKNITDLTNHPVPRLRDVTTLPSGEILVLSDGENAELLHLTSLQ